MGRNTTRTQNLTKVRTLADADVFVIGPASGDRAKGIESSVVQSIFESAIDQHNIIEITGDYTVGITDDVVVDTGPGTVTLPSASLANRPVTIKSAPISGTIIVSPDGSDTINNTVSLFVSVGSSATLVPIGGGWLTI